MLDHRNDCFSLIYIMDIHLLLVMNIPNLVYTSLDVGTPYCSTITNFVIEMTLGHVVTLPLGQVVTLLTVEQIVRISGVNSATCDTKLPTLAYYIFIVIKYILSDW